MRVVLIGADIEENLGLGMLAAVAAAGGHQAVVLPFNEAAELEAVARRCLERRPEVVGLSLQFQHRALEFLTLARRLRELGFEGHLTCGGQFPSLAWREVLSYGVGLDSVALYEAEETFGELLAALDRDTTVDGVAGLALHDRSGPPRRTAPRPLPADLDLLPFPLRYRQHSRQLGIPFIPLMGSRGCWGSCAFCSITTVYRQARAECDAPKVRRRSVDDIADEMAECCREVGGPAVFCFHDDTFFLPKPGDTLARTRALRAALDARGVGPVGLIGKGRPDSLTPELLREMRELGFLRLYVGVENASQPGADHLGRRMSVARAREALEGCRAAGIFVCYNLLIFEPWTSLDLVRENVAFIREMAVHPINFCRAEPYYGTPLHQKLAAEGGLVGSFLGSNYRIEDDTAELLFRVCHAVFRQRNFDAQGVANRYMGLGYAAELLARFYDDHHGQQARLRRRAEKLTSEISLETANFLDQAIALVEVFGDAPERLTRETALLGLRVARADQVRQAQLDDMYSDLDRLAAAAKQRERRPRQWLKRAGGVVLTASVALGAAACDRCGPQPVDPVVEPVNDGQFPIPDPVVEPVPIVEDPVPMPLDAGQPLDPAPEPIDPPPPPIEPHTQRPPRVLDPVPRPMDPPPPPIHPGSRDPLPRLMEPAPSNTGQQKGGDPAPKDDVTSASGAILGGGFRDSAARTAVRTLDLPLYDPPRITLTTSREGEVVLVEIERVGEPLSLRWEGEGELSAEGRQARWRPRFPSDTLRVAVRTEGGVAVSCLRAKDIV
jgi:radical SAM superfamily enzyme YgiQ (UPF0313 family)